MAALAFHSTVDLKAGKVLTTNSVATLFRGYEVILRHGVEISTPSFSATIS